MSKYVLKTIKVDVTNSAAALSATDLWVRSVVIQAKNANVGTCLIGDSTVTSSTGHELPAGQSLPISTVLSPKESFGELNLKDVYALSTEATGDDLIISYLDTQEV